MEQQLRQYIENIFSTVPCTVRAVEIKEEVLQNLIDKYHDLISEGKSEQAAYNIAVASIGDINELLSSVRPVQSQEESQNIREAYSKQKSKNALLTSIAVGLYILCPVPCIIFGNTFGAVLLFVFIAVATGILIYKSSTNKIYLKNDDTMVEDFKKWKNEDESRKSMKKAISSAVWALIFALYFLISFATGAWYITWVIFIIGGAVEGLTIAIIDYVNSKED